MTSGEFLGPGRACELRACEGGDVDRRRWICRFGEGGGLGSRHAAALTPTRRWIDVVTCHSQAGPTMRFCGPQASACSHVST
jgi:hypothetical protein